MIKFRDLDIGDTFDFIGPDRALNSYFQRCVKIGPRLYTPIEGEDLFFHHIGSINAKIYHAERKQCDRCGIQPSPEGGHLCGTCGRDI